MIRPLKKNARRATVGRSGKWKRKKQEKERRMSTEEVQREERRIEKEDERDTHHRTGHDVKLQPEKKKRKG